jgi:hypothetical protein
MLKPSSATVDSPPKRYDVEMIRDFLDQLRLEVRLRMLENLEQPDQKHPELLAELRKFAEKYDAGLLLAWDLRPEGCSSEEYEAVRDYLRKARAEGRKLQLEHLNALEDLFGEALRCALHRLSDGPIVARQRAADMLKKWQ